MLGQFVILPIRRAAEMIPGEFEAVARCLLQAILLGTKTADVLSRFKRCKLGSRAVLVGSADKQRFAAASTLKPAKYVGGQLRASKVAKMLNAVDVRKRAGDEDSRINRNCGHLKPPLA